MSKLGLLIVLVVLSIPAILTWKEYIKVRSEGLEGCTLTEYVTVTTGRATPEPVYYCPNKEVLKDGIS